MIRSGVLFRGFLPWIFSALALVALPAFGATVEYLHTDALGSIVAVTNSAGQVIERREYEPYGRQLTPALADGPGYTGHVSDAATGLDYMQQRYYDPGIGRLVSVDPVTADVSTGSNFNRYWYANNSPYKFIDPDGRAPCRNDNPNCSSSLDPVGQRRCEITCLGDGEARASTKGEMLRSNFDRNVARSPLGPGGKEAMHFLGDNFVEGMGNMIDGDFAPAAKNLAIGLFLKKLGPAGGKVDDLIRDAQKQFPGKAGRIELHHITPKYLGGAKNGALAPLDAAYHQQITNEFRRLHPYGSPKPDAQQLNELMKKVYEKYPLP